MGEQEQAVIAELMERYGITHEQVMAHIEKGMTRHGVSREEVIAGFVWCSKPGPLNKPEAI